MINAVQFVFLFALGAGLLVLYSALVATEDERRREAAVMRVYGASRAQVTGSQRAEFLAMGLVAGLLATLGAAAIGQLLARRVFELDLPPSPELWIAGPLAGRGAAVAQRLAVGAQGALGVAGADAAGLGLESGMAEIAALAAIAALLAVVWLVFRLQSGAERKHREMLGDLHDGLTKQGDRLGGQLMELREALTGKIDARLDQISGKVSERLDEGFKKTNETFVNVMQRLATIDEAQKKIETLTGSVVSLQELLGDKRSRGAFGEVQLEALVRNVLPPRRVRDAVHAVQRHARRLRAEAARADRPGGGGFEVPAGELPAACSTARPNEADRALAQKAVPRRRQEARRRHRARNTSSPTRPPTAR